MPTSSEIVDSSMQHTGSSKNAVVSEESDQMVLVREYCVSTLIGLNVAKVANMSFGVCWTAMCQLIRVVVWDGSHAAVCQVAKLVDVEAVFAC